MYNSCSGCSYSSLDSIVQYSAGNSGYSGGSKLDYMIAAEPKANPEPRGLEYEDVKKEVYADSYRSSAVKRVSQSYSHVVDDFLNPNRALTSFVGKASEIKEMVEETFSKLTGRKFPDDVVIRILSKEDIEKMHPATVQGFAINRKQSGLVSEVFVKEDMLDKVMVTLGHELGHVLTRRLSDDRKEEAKAFAFSLAWMKKIKEENIGNLATAIRLDAPAKNGLHDVALDLVLDLVQKGRDAFGVWRDIVNGEAIWN